MIRRIWPWAATMAALTVAACIDMSAPKGGIVSISSVLLPSPSVVLGDVLRDSVGTPAPLRIQAFDEAGLVVSGQATSFFTLDRGGHIDAAGMFFGDSIATVRIVGTVAGLQTSPVSVIVSVAPDTVVRVSGADSVLVTVGDSLHRSGPLTVRVRNSAGTGAAGFIVEYRILSGPATGTGKPPATFIGDDQLRAMPRDTTDASGNANRRVVVRSGSVGGNLDDVVVEAAVKFKGVAVRGSPIRFTVPVKLKIG